jgi:hypothetical protein
MFVEPRSSRYFCRLAGGVPANSSLMTLWNTATLRVSHACTVAGRAANFGQPQLIMSCKQGDFLDQVNKRRATF